MRVISSDVQAPLAIEAARSARLSAPANASVAKRRRASDSTLLVGLPAAALILKLDRSMVTVTAAVERAAGKRCIFGFGVTVLKVSAGAGPSMKRSTPDFAMVEILERELAL